MKSSIAAAERSNAPARARARRGTRRGRRTRTAPSDSGEPPRENARGRRTSRASRTWIIVVGALILSAVGAFASILIWALNPGSAPEAGRPDGAPVKGVEFEWRPEWSAWEGGQALAQQSLTPSPRLFALYTWLVGSAARIEPGSHWLVPALAPRELLGRLTRSARRPSIRVTLPEGLDTFQVARRLEAQGICSAARFIEVTRSSALLNELKVPGASVEGRLFPATYELLVDSKPEAVVRLLVSETEERLGKLLELHAPAALRLKSDHGFGTHEILTLASIIEKEAGRPGERPAIASVFWNRLTDPEFRPMRRLSSDPTAAYGCKLFPELDSCNGAGRITPLMLRDEKNPYNTYRHPGLPPGPIANPGEGAIEAVLAPQQTDYLFFVARGDGTHRFSRTFDEHSRNVKAAGPGSAERPARAATE